MNVVDAWDLAPNVPISAELRQASASLLAPKQLIPHQKHNSQEAAPCQAPVVASKLRQSGAAGSALSECARD